MKTVYWWSFISLAVKAGVIIPMIPVIRIPKTTQKTTLSITHYGRITEKFYDCSARRYRCSVNYQTRTAVTLLCSQFDLIPVVKHLYSDDNLFVAQVIFPEPVTLVASLATKMKEEKVTNSEKLDESTSSQQLLINNTYQLNVSASIIYETIRVAHIPNIVHQEDKLLIVSGIQLDPALYLTNDTPLAASVPSLHQQALEEGE